MHHSSPAFRLALAVFFGAAALAESAGPAPLSLFDGKTLDHWSGKSEYWRVEEGAITGQIPDGQTLKTNQWIFWDGQIHDFDLSLEFRITGGPSANSGIQYRAQQHPDGRASGYQADMDQGAVWLGRIYDEHGRALLVERGSRVAIAPDGRRWADVFADPKSLAAVIKSGQWNTYRITAAASHVEVRVNGILMSVLDDHQTGQADWSGKLAFQLHSGPGPAKVQYRNIQLTHLGKTELPARAPAAKPAPAPAPKANAAPETKGKAAPKAAPAPGIAPPAELNLGFEKGTLEGWKIQGDAWKDQPVEGDGPASRRRGNSRHAGRFWLGGFERIGDKGTGTLTSSPFTVTHPWASFLIGAAPNIERERVEIVAESTGSVIARFAGGPREEMRRVAVDLQNHQGQRLFLRIVDDSPAGWGHVNYDDLLFHDQKPLLAAPQAGSEPLGAKTRIDSDGVTRIDPLQISSDRSKRGDQSPVLWHLLPNPARPTAVANADAQRLVSDLKLMHGFQAHLLAAEPEIRQPIAFCIDERGRLWVAEAFSYPNRQPEGQGKDRILIFEDADGDGLFDSRKLFLEGLNLVSAIEVGFGGVWIGSAPNLLFIPRSADDQPGKPQILLDGFGYQDTHETLNSFTWGPDGWLYGNQGVFTQSLIGKPGSPQSQRLSLHAGVWRYHPVRHQFEIFCHGGSNQWGLDYNANGHLFMTHCRSHWGGGGTTHAIRNAHFWNQSNSGYAPFISATAPSFAPDLKNYLPASARYDSGEGGAGKPGTTAVYGGHSHVGTLIYQGDNFPPIYRDHLLTHNLHGHQINQQHMHPTGSGYETFHAGFDLLYCADPAYVPVDLQTGPDGAVYIIDWSDLQHCHNPDDEKWNRATGRIYRLSWAASYKPVQVDLGAMSDSQLIALQNHPNNWHARTARRLLQERAAQSSNNPNANPPHTGGVDLSTLNSLSSSNPLAALWIAHLTCQLTDAHLQSALKSDDDILRSWAIQLATETPGRSRLDAAQLTDLARNDPSPVVRLALSSALPALDDAAVWSIASALASHPQDKDDRFLPGMIWFGLARVIASDWPRGLALAETSAIPALSDSIRWFAAASPAARPLLIPSLTSDRDLRLLAFALKDQAALPMPAGWSAVMGSRSSDIVDQLSAQFGDAAALEKLRATLADAAQPPTRRRAALELLSRLGDAPAVSICAKLIDEPAFTSAVIPLLSRSSASAAPGIAAALIKQFDRLNPADRAAALGVLTSRIELARPLLAAVQSGSLDKKNLTALQLRQLRDLRDPDLNAQLDQAFGKVKESPQAAKDAIARLKKTYESAPLWAFSAPAGKAAFQQLCAACHAMDGALPPSGGGLGPDLTGSFRNGLDYFLENIIDPDAVVGDQFQLQIFTQTDGSVVSGVLDNESDSALTIRTPTGPVLIPKANLKSRAKLPQSLMPPGLLESLPERKAIELLKYLLSPRR